MDKAIRYAIEKNDVDTVKILVDELIGTKNCEKILYKILCDICKDHRVNLELIRALTKDISYDTLIHPLMLSICRNRLDIVEFFVSEEFEDVDQVYHKETPLSLATTHGYTEICNFLLAQYADPNLVAGRSTPIYLAAAYGYGEIVKALLDAGADPNIPSQWKSKKTAVIRAVENEEVAIVNMLIEAGADLTYKDSNGKSALDYMKESNNTQIRELYDTLNSELTYKMTITIEGTYDKVEAMYKLLKPYTKKN